MPRFEVDWIKPQGDIAYQNLTLIHMVIQKILNIYNSEFKKYITEHCVKLLVGCMKSQGVIVLRVLDIESRKTRKNQTKLNMFGQSPNVILSV